MPEQVSSTETVDSAEQRLTPREQAPLNPVSAEERLDVMDILRGFALFGILLMNIEFFNIALSTLGQFDTRNQGWDWAAGWLIKVLVEGKFYKLFSLLFGMGFAVMLVRAQQAGRPFTAWFVRRMLVLFIIGMLHMCFLWGGDILHDYALGGLLLLGWILLTRRPKMARLGQTKWFLRISLGMMLLPVLLALIAGLYMGTSQDFIELTDSWQHRQAVVALSDVKLEEAKQQESVDLQAISDTLSTDSAESSITNPDDVPPGQQPLSISDATTEQQDQSEQEMTEEELLEFDVNQRVETELENWRAVEKENNAFTQPNYWVATVYRVEMALEMLKYTPIFVLIMGFPLFMLGYWFIASGIMQHIDQQLLLFRTMTWIGLGLGLTMSIATMLIDVHPAVKDAFVVRTAAQTLFFIGQMVLTAGYLGALVLLVQSHRTRRYLRWLAPMGRMALTNYIMHSVILTSIFYGYAGGLYGEVGRAWQVVIALAILFAQALLSGWWLATFRFGPLEWLWRCLTYMQIQKFRI